MIVERSFVESRLADEQLALAYEHLLPVHREALDGALASPERFARCRPRQEYQRNAS